MNIVNKLITNGDLIYFNNYLDTTDLREKYGERPDSLWYKPDCYAKWASCLMMFDDIQRPAMKVVDLGVGDGPIAHIISHQGYDVVGVDLTRVNHPYQSLVVMVLKDAVEFLKEYEDESVDVFLDSCSVMFDSCLLYVRNCYVHVCVGGAQIKKKSEHGGICVWMGGRNEWWWVDARMDRLKK